MAPMGDPTPAASVLFVYCVVALQTSPPAFASLPDGFKSPQGSEAIALEAKLDALIEKRTGKAEALPELTETPAVRAAHAGVESCTLTATCGPKLYPVPCPLTTSAQDLFSCN